jgi:hypothetical protein
LDLKSDLQKKKQFFFLEIQGTDSSTDSSSDEQLQTQRESSTTLQNVNAPTNAVTLQRKISDRKSKRVRAKQNDIAGLTSSNEILKKSESKDFIFFLRNENYRLISAGSDDEILADDDKRPQQQPPQYQKKKRRPSFKRRKKAIYDQAQTDSGIDSRMGKIYFLFISIGCFPLRNKIKVIQYHFMV